MTSDPNRESFAGSSLGDRPRQLSALQTELFDLDSASLDAAAAAHRASYRGSDPRILVDAIMLRAGRPIPPSVSAARRAQRAERAAEAIDWLRREMATDAGRALVESSLGAALDFEGWPGPAASRSLTKAAIGVVVQLELREWAPRLAVVLDPEFASGSEPGIRRWVQGALFELFGRWFESPEAFDAAWPNLRGASAQALGLDALFLAHGRADQSAATLMEFAPTEVGPDPLGLFDPGAAAEVARAAGRAVAGGRFSPEEVIELLGRGVQAEARPVPLHARIETMLDLIQSVDPGGPVAAGVRRAVLSLGQVADDQVPDGQAPEGRGQGIGAGSVPADRAWIFLGSLRRLHYPLGQEGDELRADTLAAGTTVLQAVLADPKEQPLDPDGLKGAISGLTDLARSIADPELRGRAARPLVVELYGLVGPDSAESLGVQRAAARGLRLSLDRADAKELLRLLGGMGTSEVEYELIGALRAAISVLDPTSEDAEAVIAELFLAVAGSEFDERARALGVLLAEDVRPALAAKRRDVRARWLLERVESETSPDLRRSLLELLGRLGDPGVLGQLTERSSLMELVVGDGAESVAALGDCLLALGRGGDRARSGTAVAVNDGRFSRAARALAQVRLPAGPSVAGSSVSGPGVTRSGVARPPRLSPSRAFVLREAIRLMLAASDSEQAAPPATAPQPSPKAILPLADQIWTVKSTLELLRLGPGLGVKALAPEEFRVILDAHVAPLAASLEAPEPSATAPSATAPNATAPNGSTSNSGTSNSGAAAPDDHAFDVYALRALIHARPVAEGVGPRSPGLTGDRAALIEATLADFDRAIELCPHTELSGPAAASLWTPRALELERISFLQVSARFEAALARFEQLLESPGAPTDAPTGASPVIDEAEARAYLELISLSPSPSLTPPRLALALALLGSIAERASFSVPAGPPTGSLPGSSPGPLRKASFDWLSDLLGSPEAATPLRRALLAADGERILNQVDALLTRPPSGGD